VATRRQPPSLSRTASKWCLYTAGKEEAAMAGEFAGRHPATSRMSMENGGSAPSSIPSKLRGDASSTLEGRRRPGPVDGDFSTSSPASPNSYVHRQGPMAVGGEADYGGDKNGRERGEDDVAYSLGRNSVHRIEEERCGLVAVTGGRSQQALVPDMGAGLRSATRRNLRPGLTKEEI
jgi:hypothetical protein